MRHCPGLHAPQVKTAARTPMAGPPTGESMGVGERTASKSLPEPRS